MPRRVMVWIVLFFFTFALCTLAHCRTTLRPNAFGALITNSNPNTYLFGVPVRMKYVDTDTQVGFQPAFTPGLYTQYILFCDDVASTFDGKMTPMVVTFRSVSHRSKDGMGCHQLVNVYRIEDKKNGK
jgi:hypothetical protein